MNVERYVNALRPDSIAIFLLHGVVTRHLPGIRNYTRKHISGDEFQSVCERLRGRGTPVTMDDVLAASVDRREPPPFAFALTFDDGFRTCATVAAPILRELGIPATFYVTTDFVDRAAASWIDLIEHAVSSADVVELRLEDIGVEGHWKTDEEKLDLLDWLRSRVKPDRKVDPYAVAAEVRAQLGVRTLPDDPELDAKLTWSDVRGLSLDPLFTVGGHGHTHRILAHLDPSALEDEIRTSTHLLEREIGAPPIHYSYPEGLGYCYSDEVIGALRRRGVRCCPTAEEGVNRIGDDPFRLRRVFIT